jgi:fumarate reductase flavoprotein subunit
MSIESAAGRRFAVEAPIIIIGAGAAGQVAALTARDAGADVLLIDRDAIPAGSTALSSGMIPAAGTHLQRAKGIDDTPGILAADVQRKAHDLADPAIVDAIARASGPTVDWLMERHSIELTLVDGFLYPGHSRLRMHAPASRQGADLIASLRAAGERAGIVTLSNALARTLFVEGERVVGVRVARPDGAVEEIGCHRLILACSGYGGDPGLVRRHIPAMADAEYFGHRGNTGDAVRWGLALGAAVQHMGAYQGHGSVATPHGILITWALMMEGGIQVNDQGERFSNEHEGYSEQAEKVLAQPGGVAWSIFDARLHSLGMEFEDYRGAVMAGAVNQGKTVGELAAASGLPAAALERTLDECARLASGQGADRFGRGFTGKPALTAPYYAIKVKGALFHTQGGLKIDPKARVCRSDGAALPNLYAAGGAACGISGPEVWGYLSGNGLLSAVALGCIAGEAAAEASD